MARKNGNKYRQRQRGGRGATSGGTAGASSSSPTAVAAGAFTIENDEDDDKKKKKKEQQQEIKEMGESGRRVQPEITETATEDEEEKKETYSSDNSNNHEREEQVAEPSSSGENNNKKEEPTTATTTTGDFHGPSSPVKEQKGEEEIITTVLIKEKEDQESSFQSCKQEDEEEEAEGEKEEQDDIVVCQQQEEQLSSPAVISIPYIPIREGLNKKADPYDLSSWIALALTLDGRDKITKVCQYASRILCWYYSSVNLTNNPMAPILAKRFAAMKATLTNSRKAYRLGRSIIELHRLRKMNLYDILIKEALIKRSLNYFGIGEDDEDEQLLDSAEKRKAMFVRRASSNIGWGPVTAEEYGGGSATSSSSQRRGFYRSISNVAGT